MLVTGLTTTLQTAFGEAPSRRCSQRPMTAASITRPLKVTQPSIPAIPGPQRPCVRRISLSIASASSCPVNFESRRDASVIGNAPIRPAQMSRRAAWGRRRNFNYAAGVFRPSR